MKDLVLTEQMQRLVNDLIDKSNELTKLLQITDPTAFIEVNTAYNSGARLEVYSTRPTRAYIKHVVTKDGVITSEEKTYSED